MLARSHLPIALAALVLPAVAQDAPTPADRAAIAACLARAASDKKGPETCVGAVEGPCTQAAGGADWAMRECAHRETAVWDERLNAAYRKVLAGRLGRLETDRVEGGKVRHVTGADILRDLQRAWISFRDKKCDAAGLPMEGGTAATLLGAGCFQQETARQALWLETFDAE